MRVATSSPSGRFSTRCSRASGRSTVTRRQTRCRRYRPSNPTFDVPTFTAIITLEAHGKGTKYTALAMHKDEEGRNAHDRMGFSEGWSKALDQLVAQAKTMWEAAGSSG